MKRNDLHKSDGEMMTKEEARWNIEAAINYLHTAWSPQPSEGPNLEKIEAELIVNTEGGLVNMFDVQTYFDQINESVPYGDVVSTADVKLIEDEGETKLRYTICYDTNQFPNTTCMNCSPFFNYLYNGFCESDYLEFYTPPNAEVMHYCSGPLEGEESTVTFGADKLIERLTNSFLYGQRKTQQVNYYYTDYEIVGMPDLLNPLLNPYDATPGDGYLDYLRLHNYGPLAPAAPGTCLSPQELLFYRDIGIIEYAQNYAPSGKQLMSVSVGIYWNTVSDPNQFGWSYQLYFATPHEQTATPIFP